jgi:hypothetical protein
MRRSLVRPLSTAVFLKASRFQLYSNAMGAVLPANGEQFIDMVKGNVVALLRSSNIRTKIWWRLKTAWRDLRISCVCSPNPCIVNFNGRSALKLTRGRRETCYQLLPTDDILLSEFEVTTRNAKQQRSPAMLSAGDIPREALNREGSLTKAVLDAEKM